MDKNAFITGYLKQIEKQLATDPHNEMLWLYKGICYLDMDDRPGTIAALTEGLAQCPQYGRLLEERGHRYINIGEYAKAGADLALAHELYPTDHSINYHLGLSHYYQAEYHQAELAFRRCLDGCSVYGDTVSATNWLWNCLVHQAKTKEAQELLDGVPLGVDERPEGVSGYYHLLLMYKNVMPPQEVMEKAGNNPVGFVTMGYGVSNYYRFVAKDEQKADEMLAEILSTEPRPWHKDAKPTTWTAGFGYHGAVTEKYRLDIYPN